jgi:hypothetical protein
MMPELQKALKRLFDLPEWRMRCGSEVIAVKLDDLKSAYDKETARQPDRIVVVVDGGVVQDVFTTFKTECEIIDWDNIKAGDNVEATIEANEEALDTIRKHVNSEKGPWYCVA